MPCVCQSRFQQFPPKRFRHSKFPHKSKFGSRWGRFATTNPRTPSGIMSLLLQKYFSSWVGSLLPSYIMMQIYFHIHPPNGATFLFLPKYFNLDIKYILDLQTDTSRSCLDVRAYFSSSGPFLPTPPSRQSGSQGILQKYWFGQIFVQVRIVLDVLNLFTGVIIFGVLVCKVCLAWINRWLMFRSWWILLNLWCRW